MMNSRKKPPFPNFGQAQQPSSQSIANPMSQPMNQPLNQSMSLEAELEMGMKELLGKELHGHLPSLEDSTDQLLKLLSKFKPGNNSQEGFVFGFPISFN